MSESSVAFTTHRRPVQDFLRGRLLHSMRVSRPSSLRRSAPYSMTLATRSTCLRNRGCSLGISPSGVNQCHGSTTKVMSIPQYASRLDFGPQQEPKTTVESYRYNFLIYSINVMLSHLLNCGITRKSVDNITQGHHNIE